MAITKLNPRTIMLSADSTFTVVNDIAASAAITPGFLVEMHDSTGLKFRANASVTELAAMSVAIEQGENNTTFETAYAANDLCKVAYIKVGAVFFGIIPSGQDISFAELLSSNGDGKLRTAGTTTAAANLGNLQSLDAPGAVTADTRIRVQRIA